MFVDLPFILLYTVINNKEQRLCLFRVGVAVESKFWSGMGRMNCPNCGKPNPRQAQTCGNCGHSLRAPVFPSVLPSAPPEALSAAHPSRTPVPTSQKPGCLGSLLKRVLAMLAATIVGWLCGLVNALFLPAFAKTQDTAWLVTLILSGAQMCLSFVIALALGLTLRSKRRLT